MMDAKKLKDAGKPFHPLLYVVATEDEATQRWTNERTGQQIFLQPGQGIFIGMANAAQPVERPDCGKVAEAIAMLRYVLPYIPPRAADAAKARTGPMEDAYINTQVRKFLESAPAADSAATEQADDTAFTKKLAEHRKNNPNYYAMLGSAERASEPKVDGEAILRDFRAGLAAAPSSADVGELLSAMAAAIQFLEHDDKAKIIGLHRVEVAGPDLTRALTRGQVAQLLRGQEPT